jgi:hypothetical protein
MNSDLTRTVTSSTMQLLRLLVTCLVVTLMSLSQVATASELTPLSPADREALSAVRTDPLPKTLTQGIHFWVSDEAHHHLFRDTLKERGGVYVGIGTNQNFAMAAWQRPELIVLLDFDQSIIDLHSVYAVIFAHATTPEEHLAMWSRKRAKEVRALLIAAMPGEEPEATRRRDRALRAYKYGRGRVSRGLTKMKTRYTTWGEPSFINDQAEYDWVRAMSMAGRIVAIRGDLTGPHTLSDLGATLKAQGREVTTFYMSNTEQYFRYTPRFKANMTTLPLTEDAVMLRTRAWRVGGLPKPGKKKKPLYYAYVVQSFTDWVTWLEAPKVHGVRDILTRETRVKNALITVGAHPSQK